MKIGIVGLPNVGKSTLFNSITKAGAESANYPFTTIEPNVGMVSVPDERLKVLSEIYNAKKIVPAYIEITDIAGLVKGASKGEGLGNKFLSHIREVDAIMEVVRCFEDENVVHVDGSVDSERDASIINLELIYSDIATVQKRKERVQKLLRADKEAKLEFDLLEKIEKELEDLKPARALDLSKEEELLIKPLQLLTRKPILYVANVDESGMEEDNENVISLRKIAEEENANLIKLCVKMEQEISELDTEEDRQEMLEALGMEMSGLDKVIKESYDLLGLMSFLTAGQIETRAWTIKKGTKAPQAAGKIHTDIERGFIKAEIVSYDDLVSAGSLAKAREKGLIRIEGKEYIMQEGDIVDFRFNV